jgi:spore maturation protein CgeB
MKIAFLVHALASCWNNGNAHFLRGVARALQAKGHAVEVFEPQDGWSRANLLQDAGPAALAGFEQAFPTLRPRLYTTTRGALDAVAAFEPDLVLMHEWNDPELVNAVGAWRKRDARFTLLFHDTHHRALTRPEDMSRFDLSFYDGVLTFGACLSEIYERQGWGGRVWTWHEAADTRLFRPRPAEEPEGDLVWVGNWGDEERSEELRTFLIGPSRRLGLRTTIHGVRYPEAALQELAESGIRFGGWLANHRVPEVFARYRVTVHVQRRPYAEALRGIPTIRVFEALACGIPLVSAPWEDSEGLFPEGAFLMARNGEEMERQLRAVLSDPDLAASLRRTGLAVIRERHSCDHRADELLSIHRSLAAGAPATFAEAV